MYLDKIGKLLKAVPGEKTFGVYRFLPVFFCLGAGLEFSMIKWRVGKINFYDTYKKREARNLIEDKLMREIEFEQSEK